MTTTSNANRPENQATETKTDHVRPLPGMAIQWASTDDLDQELELMNNRRWLNEELIATSQKHWNCSRPQALKRLLRGLDECSE